MAGTKAAHHDLGYSDTVAVGAQKGLDECKRQFQWHLWNCPQSVFTQVSSAATQPPVRRPFPSHALTQGISSHTQTFSKNNQMPVNRETAFVHAIISAGIVHTVTRNCSKGQDDKCRCDPSKTEKSDSSNARGKFRWGGCSDDVEFGISLAKSFLDQRETGHDPKALINLHNNNVGRMVSQGIRSV